MAVSRVIDAVLINPSQKTEAKGKLYKSGLFVFTF